MKIKGTKQQQYRKWIELKDWYEQIGLERKNNKWFVAFCSQMAAKCEQMAKTV